jgi:phage protein D
LNSYLFHLPNYIVVNLFKSYNTQHAYDRLARERERLPEEYQRQVNDERKRIETLENTLKEREGALRAEEVRRLTVLDLKSKEVAEEAARARMRFEVDIADER